MVNPFHKSPPSSGVPSLWSQLTQCAAALRRAGAASAIPVGAPSSPHVRLRPHRRDGRRRARHHTLARLRGGHGDRRQPCTVYSSRPRRDTSPGLGGSRGVRPDPPATHATGCRVEQGNGYDANWVRQGCWPGSPEVQAEIAF